MQNDFGSEPRKTLCVANVTIPVVPEPKNIENKHDKTIGDPVGEIVTICVMFSFWFLFFIPLFLGISRLNDLCVKINKCKKDHWTKKADNYNFEIIQADDEKTSSKIATIALLGSLWFLVFPLFKAKKMLDTYRKEYELMMQWYNEVQAIMRKKEEEYCKRFNDAIYPERAFTPHYTRNILLKEAQWKISNNMRMIRESAMIIEETISIDTFFYRLNFLIEKYMELIPLEPFLDFNGVTPTEAYNGILDQRDNEIYLFVNRYLAYMLDSASYLKTERGRQNRYKNAYADFQKHYHEISQENCEFIDAEFSTLIT